MRTAEQRLASYTAKVIPDRLSTVLELARIEIRALAAGTAVDPDAVLVPHRFELLAIAGALHGADTLDGGAGDDELSGNGGDDQLYGLAGDDTP